MRKPSAGWFQRARAAGWKRAQPEAGRYRLGAAADRVVISPFKASRIPHRYGGNEGMGDERSVPKPGGTAGILPAPAAKPLPGRFLIPGAEKEWNFYGKGNIKGRCPRI